MVGTKEWLGATEVVILLASLGIDSQLIDFHRPTAEDNIHHPELFSWVLQYFLDSPDRLPLLLQRQGHSQVIIGVEQTETGVTLLVLDPIHTKKQLNDLDSSDESLKLIRRNLKDLTFDQYQIVAIKGVFKDAQQKEVFYFDSYSPYILNELLEEQVSQGIKFFCNVSITMLDGIFINFIFFFLQIGKQICEVIANPR